MTSCLKKTLTSLACICSETHNLQAMLFSSYLVPKQRLWPRAAFVAETVETGNKNHCMTKAMNVLQRKLRFRTFLEQVRPQITIA